MFMRLTVAVLAAITATCVVPSHVGATQNRAMTEMPKPAKSGHAAINGVNYYYAVYGKGEPLLLLHGGLGQIEMFGPNLGLLAKRREVIGVDLHGHGRTDLGNREISLFDMANDFAVLLRKLGHQKVDVMGYSMGGGAAFRLAVQHPDLVRRLVIVSAAMSQDQFFPEMLPQQAAVGSAMMEQFKGSPTAT
jgi:pimeloyl-ACP methyl ester carboxylesterase